MQGTRNKLTVAICACLTAGALASAGAIAHETDTSSGVALPPASTSVSDAAPVTDGRTDADQSNVGAATSTSGTSADRGTTTTTPETASPGATSGATTMAPGTTAVSPSPHDRSASGVLEPRTSSDYDQSRSGTTGASGSAPGTDELVWFAVPAALQNQGNHLSNGCWVKLYSDENFKGQSVSIIGPANVRQMRSPSGQDDWESAEVGPNATVTTYEAKDFGSRSATLSANQRYPDLEDSKLGLSDDIESMKVTCRNTAGGSSTN